MKALMLGACLAATIGAPALAQPGDQGGYGNQPDPYYDQPPAPQPPPQPPRSQQPAPPTYQGGYQGDEDNDQDRGYGQYQPPPRPPPGQPGFQVYQGGQAYGGYAPDQRAYRSTPQDWGSQNWGSQNSRSQDWRYGASSGVHYTGRTGSAWRNPEGQYCVWRETSWLQSDGRPAYRWVPRCRDD
jgi:hypothetical protein